MAKKTTPSNNVERFSAPMYGEVMPVGTEFKDAEGNTRVVTEDGTKIIRKA